MRLSEKSLDELLDLGAKYDDKGNHKKALEIYERVQKLYPELTSDLKRTIERCRLMLRD